MRGIAIGAGVVFLVLLALIPLTSETHHPLPGQKVHHGSVVSAGSSNGYLDNHSGGQAKGKVCNNSHNGDPAIQRYYSTNGTLLNKTVDNYVDGVCVIEIFEKPKAAHDLWDGHTSNYSIHY